MIDPPPPPFSRLSFTQLLGGGDNKARDDSSLGGGGGGKSSCLPKPPWKTIWIIKTVLARIQLRPALTFLGSGKFEINNRFHVPCFSVTLAGMDRLFGLMFCSNFFGQFSSALGGILLVMLYFFIFYLYIFYDISFLCYFCMLIIVIYNHEINKTYTNKIHSAKFVTLTEEFDSGCSNHW